MIPGDESALSRSQTSPGWSGMASYGPLHVLIWEQYLSIWAHLVAHPYIGSDFLIEGAGLIIILKINMGLKTVFDRMFVNI